MSLTKNTSRRFDLGDINEFLVAASTTIYQGAVVGENGSGYARGLTAGDRFLGFAEAKADNSDGSAGDITVRVISRGKVQVSISSLAITDLGKPVYASDDGTFTLTAGANSRIGTVHRWVSSGIGIVEFDANEARGSHEIVFAGEHTTVGGAAAEAITITGLKTTDIVTVVLKTPGSTPRTISSYAITANTLTVTFSGDPSSDHVVVYDVKRAVNS